MHAKALTEVVSEFVCREDLLRLEGSLRHEIEESEKRLILHINLVKTELMAKIDGVDAKIDRVDGKVDSLRSEFEARLKAIDHDLLVNRWLSGLIISLNIAMAIKIFFP
ncbi:hypothetical protein BN2497_6329 [Janthinobacterium sp. CG23_2]|nr:hypothetical protein BN2497_6329 [Janthinobacterium sp. CG23_2]CUU29562.1 hypothetical protein BN3177_6329 [Janthinobacterium sp. CG23_2]